MDAPDLRRFSGFELNVRTGELRRGNARLALERQPALALSLLVSHAGHLVTRAELCQAIWSNDTHVDFDRGLNYCLRQIRIALGDDAKVPRFVETIPRQGYRFIAELSPAPRRVRTFFINCWKPRIAAATLAGLMLATFVVEAGPRNEAHHRIAVQIVRAVHGFLF
jgi:DNA-binding winged helix-turn-helix (wHTH) protein